MNVYLAARYERREELAAYALDLPPLGHVVTSRWLDGSHGESYRAITDSQRRAAAVEDLADISQSDLFVAFTGSGGRGGRHVETGVAIALSLPVWLVGEPENVFHFLPGVSHFSDWEAVKRTLSPIDVEAKAVAADLYQRAFGRRP